MVADIGLEQVEDLGEDRMVPLRSVRFVGGWITHGFLFDFLAFKWVLGDGNQGMAYCTKIERMSRAEYS